jgi:hypothetical protein
MTEINRLQKLNSLLEQTTKLIKKGSRNQGLIMANVTVIESLEYQLNIPIENRVINKKIFNGY